MTNYKSRNTYALLTTNTDSVSGNDVTFTSFGGNLAHHGKTTETAANTVTNVPYYIKGFIVNSISNNKSDTTTFNHRVDAADTTATVTVAGSATGVTEVSGLNELVPKSSNHCHERDSSASSSGSLAFILQTEVS